MNWHVAQVEPTRERRVCERLTAMGAEAWRHELLPGYVLASGIHPAKLRYTEDVTRVLPFSDAPTPIDGDLVLALQETCRAYEQACQPMPIRHPDAPIAGMARKMVANLFASAGFGVTLQGNRVELDEHPPRLSAPRGARRNHGHDARRAVKLGAAL
jgi:hypothetical protein